MGTNPNGTVRDTEITDTNQGAVISYDQGAHPGSLRIQTDVGDQFGNFNTSRNCLFRSLPTNWWSLRFKLTFAPVQDTDQAHLTLYQDDNNYVQLGLVYNTGLGGLAVPFVTEVNGVADHVWTNLTATTNIYLRMDRNFGNQDITGFYSVDGTNWVNLGVYPQSLVNPRVEIWASTGQFGVAYPNTTPFCDARELIVLETNPPVRSISYALESPPSGALIGPSGNISWTPTEAQGPGVYTLKTVVWDNAQPQIGATNSFTVTVNEINVAPVLNVPPQTNILALASWSEQATATDSDVPANSLTFDLISGPLGLTVAPTGLISWTPTANQSGSSNWVQIRLTDTNAAAVNSTSFSVTNSFAITVGPVLTVTANNASRIYGISNPAFTVNYSGFIDNDTPAVLQGSLVINTPATISSAIGTYPIYASGLTSTKYTIVYVDGQLAITSSNAVVSLGNLAAVYDGSGHAASAVTVPAGLVVNLTYDGAVSAPTNAGNYVVVGTIADANYAGSATNTLVISKSNAPVTLGNLAAIYNGSGHAASAVTVPAGLVVNLTYDGAVSAPTNAGNYVVVGTIADANYAGSATNTLVISKSNAVVSLGNLAAVYDGSGHAASAVTVPAGLVVNLTYDGVVSAPTNAGNYVVVGTIADANYAGSATNTLVISKSNAPVTLGNLAAVYDGSGHAASAVTVPAGLVVNLTYDGVVSAPTNAGNYVVVGTIADANYAGSATNTLVISKSNAPVTLGNLAAIYNGSGHAASAVTVPAGLVVNLTYDGAVSAPTNAGNYVVVGTIADANYAGSATNTLVISKSNAPVTLGNLAAVYDGSGHAASAVTVPAGLVVNLTYDGVVSAPTNAGNYVVVGTIADANYAGSATNTLVISKSNAPVTLGNLAAIYNGSGHAASAVTVPAGLVVNLTYDGAVSAPTNAGNYVVVGTIADANYAGSATNTLVISKSNAVVTLGNLAAVYDGSGHAASAVTVPAGLVVNLTYDGVVSAPTNAGNYVVVGTIADANYAGSATNTLVISKSNAVVTLGNLAAVYDGSGHAASAVTVPAGLVVNLTYDGVVSAPTNAGNYVVVGTIADANYAGSATNTLVISKSNAPVTLGNLAAIYNGSGHAASAVTVPAGLVVNLTYDGAVSAPTNAGNYVVVGTIADANYAGSATNTLVISKSNAVVTLGNLAAVYDGSGHAASAVTVPAGLVVNLTYDGVVSAPTNAGNYVVVGTIADANYAGSATNTLVISKSNAVVSLGNLAAVYDGSGHAASAVTVPAGLVVNLTYDGVVSAPTNAGNYVVVGTIADANYAGSATNTLVISKSNAVVTLGNLAAVYDGSGHAASAVTVPAGLVVNLTYDGVVSAPTNAGNYVVVGTIADANYAGSATNTLVISKSNAVVTLGNLAAVYDGSGHAASAVTVPAGLVVNLTYDGVVSAPTNAGNYVVVGTIADANYAGSATNTLVISKSNAVVSLGNLAAVYDGSGHAASAVTVPAGLVVNLTYDGVVSAPTNAGNYVVVGTIADANYAGSATNTLVISKSNAVVTLGNLAAVYDGSGHAASAVTVPAGLVVNLTYDGVVSAPTNAGNYVVVGTIADANYAGSATNTLVISKSNAVVSLGNLAAVYDGSGHAASAVTVPAGLVVNLTYDGVVSAPTNAGNYVVVGTIADANYAGSATNTLVISKSNAVVSLGNLAAVYDGSGHAASAVTVPAGLVVNLTYDGAVSAPTNAGNYVVVGTIADANYAGSATNTLVISKSNAVVSLGNLAAVYDGSGHAASAVTVPAGLVVNLTYDGVVSAPTNAGNYVVVGTIADANYAGSATNTLVISKSNAVVTLGSLNQNYNGAARIVTVATAPAGLNVVVTYNGSISAPTNAGSYQVIGAISELNYTGSVTNTLTVTQPDPIVLTVNVGAPGTVVVSWNSVPGQVYRVQFKDDLNDVSWTDLPPNITATGSVTTLTNAVGSESRRFFRVYAIP
ncbi:MAG: MBG domain-containing protein [Verrucomicrobiota bacterium]